MFSAPSSALELSSYITTAFGAHFAETDSDAQGEKASNNARYAAIFRARIIILFERERRKCLRSPYDTVH